MKLPLLQLVGGNLSHLSKSPSPLFGTLPSRKSWHVAGSPLEDEEDEDDEELVLPLVPLDEAPLVPLDPVDPLDPPDEEPSSELHAKSVAMVTRTETDVSERKTDMAKAPE